MSLTSERLRQAQQILDEALARPAEERTAFVVQACAGDGELLAEVTSLLASADSLPAGFMRTPEPVRAPDELVGKEVAGYRIEGIIGSGGMGTVYAATQDHPKRKVALKVMRASVVSRAALRRFQFEVEILGRLRHPNIAQIYQAGMSDVAGERVPFFALEYIPDARPITAYAEEAGLGMRQRLELLAKVCDAVHHGHQKGIIHRDLKPANMLVDAEGVPKVIDFGVARATDSDLAVTTQRTDVGQMIGTLAYMSPEQCEAELHEIDTRSDVYSLGVVLYELLCGRLPYELAGASVVNAARTICEKAPAQPSRIDRRLRGDVEMIVLKALEKDRTRRYQSAGGLAEDIRRYLRGAPTEARPPTMWTRGVRWASRNPVLTTALLCAVLVGCSVAVAIASVSYARYTWFTPQAVVISTDKREAVLVTSRDVILHRWRSEAGEGFSLGRLIDRPRQLGGGQLALLWYTDTHPNRRVLRAFEICGSLTQPVWEGRQWPGAPLPGPHDAGYTPDQFSVELCAVEDVFPERPGLEVIAAHNHMLYSERVIRVYDLQGVVLYEVWYQGSLAEYYWMKDARQLVFLGHNNDADWPHRGYSGVKDPFPVVVFAIRPVLGSVSHDFLRSEPGEGPLHPVWCRCLFPPREIGDYDQGFRPKLRPPTNGLLGKTVNLNLVWLGDRQAGLSWDIDASGHKVPGSLVVNDVYKGIEPPLPDPDLFQLADLPPITSQPAPE